MTEHRKEYTKTKRFHQYLPGYRQLIESTEYANGVYGALTLEDKLKDPMIIDYITRCVSIDTHRNVAAFNKRNKEIRTQMASFLMYYRVMVKKAWDDYDLTERSLEYLCLASMVANGTIVQLPGISFKMIKTVFGGLNKNAILLLQHRGYLVSHRTAHSGGFYAITPAGKQVVMRLQQHFTRSFDKAHEILVAEERATQIRTEGSIERTIETRTTTRKFWSDFYSASNKKGKKK